MITVSIQVLKNYLEYTIQINYMLYTAFVGHIITIVQTT